MNNLLRCLRLSVTALLLAVSFESVAADIKPSQQAFPQDELDALLSPVALYPYGLLYKVLMAST